MASTNKTTNYNLPQWIGTDRPSFADDFNPAFEKIDTGMHNALLKAEEGTTQAEAATSIANEAKESATTATTTANSAKTTAESAETTANNVKSIAEQAKSTADSASTTATNANANVSVVVDNLTDKTALTCDAFDSLMINYYNKTETE